MFWAIFTSRVLMYRGRGLEEKGKRERRYE
jgi:hypothetical protein